MAKAAKPYNIHWMDDSRENPNESVKIRCTMVLAANEEDAKDKLVARERKNKRDIRITGIGVTPDFIV